MITRRIEVSGRVQGVGFRWSCRDEAQRLGITGWVRNRPNGTVEVLCHGQDAVVERFVAWCRRGPRGALVTEVSVHAEPEMAPPTTSFEIAH